MDSILTLAVIIGLGCWFYKTGKRDGSRAGFRIGRRRGRTHRRRR